jgi:hypothetical protein
MFMDPAKEILESGGHKPVAPISWQILQIGVIAESCTRFGPHSHLSRGRYRFRGHQINQISFKKYYYKEEIFIINYGVNHSLAQKMKGICTKFS